MEFRVWHDGIKFFDGKCVDAQTVPGAARDYIEGLDVVGDAFPNDNDGDRCTIHVCEWEELDEKADEPKSRAVAFKLEKERKIELTWAEL